VEHKTVRLALVAALASGTTHAEPIAKNAFSIIDGDTIRVAGASAPTRLVGFNTPETDPNQMRCAAEGPLGLRATARLQELILRARTVDLAMVPCSCPPGTQGTPACDNGRSCGVLRVDGRDVGAILISQGLAAPLVCGPTRCPPTPRPWCQAGG
jgi:endonuclease YncB( thermonuclease family)